MLLKLYEKNNNPNDLQRIVDVLNDGGLIIYPTDTMYAIGCHGLKERAIERIWRIKDIAIPNRWLILLGFLCAHISHTRMMRKK